MPKIKLVINRADELWKGFRLNNSITGWLSNCRLASQSSQTAVFVFILLIIGLTIGLSLSTRTIRDLQGSSGSDLSSRAFAAAEGGVEDALRQDLSTIDNGTYTAPAKFLADNGSTYSYKVVATSEFSSTVPEDETVQLTLKDNSGNDYTGKLNIFWVRKLDQTENSSGSRPSLELTFVQNNGGSFSLVDYAVNAETRNNNFQNPDGSTVGMVTNLLPSYGNGQNDNRTYTNELKINIPSGSKFEALRLRPLYNKAALDVIGSGLPPNSYQITSQGVAGSSVTRVVQVTRTFPALPSIFDYVLFNGSTIPISK